MKKILLTTVSAFLLFVSVNAQTKKVQVFVHDKATMTELGLSAEQQAKILEIKAITDPQIRQARSNTALTPEELKKELYKVYTNRDKMQNEVLTTEQIQKLKEMRAAAKAANAANKG